MMNTILFKTFILIITGLSLNLCFSPLAMAAALPADTSAKTPPVHRVVVYYLHNTFRCSSCNSIGNLTQAAVLGGEVENLKTGEESRVAPAFQHFVDQEKLSFSFVNVDEPENHHFLQNFQTSSKFPVIAEIKDGEILRFKVLDRVWKLLEGENSRFISYIQQNVHDFFKNL